MVVVGSIAYLRKDESGTDPDGGGTESKSCGKCLAVEDTSCSDDLHWLAGHRALVAPAKACDFRDEDSGWDVSSVTTSLTTLGADHVGTELEALLDVLRVANHVPKEKVNTSHRWWRIG